MGWCSHLPLGTVRTPYGACRAMNFYELRRLARVVGTIRDDKDKSEGDGDDNVRMFKKSMVYA